MLFFPSSSSISFSLPLSINFILEFHSEINSGYTLDGEGIFPLSFAVPLCGTIKQIIDINFYDLETKVKETVNKNYTNDYNHLP